MDVRAVFRGLYAALRPVFAVAVTVLIGAALVGPASATSIVIEAGRIAPPVATAPLEVFARISNRGPGADRLLAIRADAFSGGELRTPARVDGVIRTQPAGPLALAAGEAVSLAPHGLRGFLYDPARRVRRGETVRVVFVFERAGEVSALLPVAEGLSGGLGVSVSPPRTIADPSHDADSDADSDAE